MLASTSLPSTILFSKSVVLYAFLFILIFLVSIFCKTNPKGVSIPNMRLGHNVWNIKGYWQSRLPSSAWWSSLTSLRTICSICCLDLCPSGGNTYQLCYSTISESNMGFKWRQIYSHVWIVGHRNYYPMDSFCNWTIGSPNWMVDIAKYAWGSKWLSWNCSPPSFYGSQ